MTFISPSPCAAGAAVPPCVSESIATSGLCLGDGTPIAVVTRQTSHECGAAAADPVVLGWIDLLTGGFNAGNPPGGTRDCNTHLEFQLAGLLCDIQPDGSNAQTVAIEYHYDVNGALISTRIVSVTTGTTYVPTGVLSPCGGEDDFEYEVLCDDNGQFIRQYRTNDAGVIVATDHTLAGAAYVPVGSIVQCTSGVVFAGFVCDSFAGTPFVPAVLPSCPGTPLAAAAPSSFGAGYAEGPPGTFIQTANVNASISFDRTPNDDQHGICAVHFELNAANGNNGFAAYGWGGVEVNNNPISSDPAFIAAIEAAIGVGSDNPMPAGATASAVVGGTTVTFTNTGPSNNLCTSSGTGNFLTREGDGDGQASGVTLEFNPPLRSFTLQSNTGFDGASGITTLQRANATPGTAAIPAQPGGTTEVKQFRNPDGTSFYENLDGSTHPVLGTIGDCGEKTELVLCDATGAQFLRVYNISGGTITGFADYDFSGNLFAPVPNVHICAETLATYRHTPIEVLCWTETANPTNVIQFLRRYLVDQDGVNVVATIDSLLDGSTPFVAGTSGTVAQCCCDSSSASPCASTVLGTICYVPPPASIPGVSVRGQLGTGNGAVLVNPNTVTLADFQGSGVDLTFTIAAPGSFSQTPLAINMLGAGPDLVTVAFSQPVIVTALQTGDMDDFATGGEFWDTFSIPVTGVTGTLLNSPAGTIKGTVDNQNPDGDIQFNSGPLSSFSYVRHSAGGAENMRQLAITTIASSTTQTQGTAAVVRDCETGVVSYIDIATGAVLDISTITIVDCSTAATASDDVELVELCDNNGAFLRVFTYDSTGAVVTVADTTLAGAPYATVGTVVFCSAAAAAAVTLKSQGFIATPGTPWTPALVLGTLTSVTFTVLSGTATVTDFNGTVSAGLPTGLSTTWNADDTNTLTPPTSIASVGGSVWVNWTER